VTNPKFVVRRGSLTAEEYLQAYGAWGDYRSAKRFASQDAAEKFYRQRFTSENFGIFPVSVARRDNPHPKEVRLIADRFGLTAAEARHLATHPRVVEIRDQHERWLMAHGYPAPSSSLSRGKLLEMMGYGRDRAANPRKDNVKLRKGTRVRTQYRGVDVRGSIHLVKKDGYAVVILDEADADATLTDAVEVPVSRVTVERQSRDNSAWAKVFG
jgi:hypothetical protein